MSSLEPSDSPHPEPPPAVRLAGGDDEAAARAAPAKAAVDVTLPLSSTTTLPPGLTVRTIGDYELLSEIGRGGMGVVYRARQISLNRIVAVKTILIGQLASEEEVKRFYAGAALAANLDHPGIVPVYEVGNQEGQHYFSMAYIDGQSLSARLAAGPMEPCEGAALVRAVAEAVQHAHSRGLIHRDLKPANILLDREGRPRVTDFDLGKRIHGDSGLTATGQILGTASFMPPEQAAGKLELIGPASDVYALGATLYCVLTGRPPFQADNPLDTLVQVLHNDPVPPRLLNPKIPRDLETICLKCLEKDIELRYPSAQALVDDLGRFLQGEPIEASSINLLDRVTRTLSHSPNDKHFQNWGAALMAIGGIIFLAHAVMYALAEAGGGPWTSYWIPRSVMLLALLVLLGYARPQSILPTSSTERPIWAVWIGYLLSLAMVYVVSSLQHRPTDDLHALSALFAAMGFFAMGSIIWGGCYAIGLAFLLAAPLLAKFHESSVFWFGVLWLLALTVLGGRYWHMGRSQAKDRGTAGRA